MKKEEMTLENLNDDHPPIFKNWNQMYILVLVIHAFIIFAMYVFTKTYS